MSQPLVSIVLTNYNGESVLRETIQSVLDQTFTDWELIIVDDCSTDRSLEVIRQFDDPRIRLHVNERNEQVSKTHRIGNRLAGGRYIAILDHDDLWAAEKLQIQVDYLESHPETAACLTWPDFIDENGDPLDEPELAAIFQVPNRSRTAWIYDLLTTGNHFANDSAMIRKEVLDQMEQDDITLTQLHDYDLWLRVVMRHEIRLIEKPLMSYRKFRSVQSNSAKSIENQRRLFFEYAWVISHAILSMEPSLFRQVFADHMVNPLAESEEEFLCEKAILLSSGLFPGNCREYAFSLFHQLLSRPETAFLLEDQYGIRQHEVYRLTGKPIFHDRSTADEINQLKREVSDLSAQLESTLSLYRQASDDFRAIQQSSFWRLTRPLRALTRRGKAMLQKHEKFYLYARLGKTLLRHGKKETSFRHQLYLYDRRMRAAYGERPLIPYEEWKAQKDVSFPHPLRFSILVPLYNTPREFLIPMLESVLAQSYPHWELCLADGSDGEHRYVQEICEQYHAGDARILYLKLDQNRGISENTNRCVSMASGDYFALLDHDDLLHPSALYEYASAIESTGADLLYSDEAVFETTPFTIIQNHYKPDYSPDTLRSYNYICHFLSFSRALLENQSEVFRSRYDGSQDYDLVLRLSEKAGRIRHIPKVLYYWRTHAASVAGHVEVKSYAVSAAKAALQDHLRRIGLDGEVEDSSVLSTYRIRYRIAGQPPVSIIIPNKNHLWDLRRCVCSILRKTTYSSFEILIIDNGSTQESLQNYYEEVQKDPRIRILRWDEPFNFAAICNYGAREARGDYLLLLNNDTRIITGSWLEEMLGFAQRRDVGAVGAMLYYPDDTVQHAGVILRPGPLADHIHKNRKRGTQGYQFRLTLAQNFSAVTGACLMTRKAVWEEMNGLDESFAVAYNDVDYCLRLREKGYLIVWTPYAELYHYESQSRGLDDTPEKMALNHHEVELLLSRWGDLINSGDPYYNPHLVHTSLKV